MTEATHGNSTEDKVQEHKTTQQDGKEPKKILGLVGSPRSLGNCEVFIKEMARNASTNHQLSLIRLPSLHIMPCKGCYGCIMGTPCPNRDDLDFLLSEIASSDGILVASPVYFLDANSIFKRILDRGFLFFDHLDRTFGKPCVLVNTYGIKDRMGAAPHTLRTFASFLGLDIKGSVNIKAALPGEILRSTKNRDRAEQLGLLLFSERRLPNRHGCPFCGSEIVRMTGNGFICALCHGTFRINGEGTRVKIRDGGIFGGLEHRLLHKAWLQTMKNRFLKERREILRQTLPLKDVGEWITP